MVRPFDYVLSVTVHAGHKVLIEVDDNCELLAGDPQGIWGKLLRPRPIQSLDVIITLINYFMKLFFSLMTIPSKGGGRSPDAANQTITCTTKHRQLMGLPFLPWGEGLLLVHIIIKWF
jgi:hypothetical protein